jgi:uncharacterized protein YfaP (DUF2135 family)
MNKILQSIVLLSPILLPLTSSYHAPALAQERQGCFMVNAAGSLRDLSEFCPSTNSVATSATPQLGTGDIQATLRWTSPDDLDMAITDPSGNTVTFSNPNVPSGGTLDVDANAGCVTSTSSPIENVFWPTGRAPQGNYSIAVSLYTRCNSSGPISFNLTLLVQGTTQTLTGTLDDQNPVATFPFSLPLQNSAQSPSTQPTR